MADLKVDTAAILTAANDIEKINKSMKEYFSEVNDAIRILDNAWDGNTASRCIEELKKGNSDMMNSRYNSMDNFVKFLRGKVSPEYLEAEVTNVKLADQFK